MFQYAFMKSLKQKGRDARGNLGFYRNHPELMKFCLTDVFPNIDITFVEDEIFDDFNKRWKKIKEQEETLKEYLLNYADKFFWIENPVGMYDKHVFETINCVFVGYWQTEKYFKGIRNELLTDFSFKLGDLKLEKMKKELSSNKKYVSVHIRRGDYLKNLDRYGDLSETNYYTKAKEYLSRRVDNPIYVYFSDDIQWVKEKFYDKNGIFIEKIMFEDYQNWYDMYLMSQCKHNIIANSTFSWWGAWLNPNKDKIVIAPKVWNHMYERKDICPPEWIRM